MRLLVVDDDEDNLALFSIILQEKGFEVDSYKHPGDALSHFKPNYYDVVILDYLLPSVNGLQLYRKLRAIDDSIKAIVLTASQEAIEVINPGEVKVLRKPIYPSKLVEVVKTILVSSELTGSNIHSEILSV